MFCATGRNLFYELLFRKELHHGCRGNDADVQRTRNKNRDKTRLIEFGKYAIERRQLNGEGRPETFDFLGFTHLCAQTRSHGWFTIHRHAIAKRMRAKFQEIKAKLRQRKHRPAPRVTHPCPNKRFHARLEVGAV